MPGSLRRLSKRLVTPPLLLLATLFLVAEELQWRLAKLYELLGRLPLLRQVESWIRGLGPYPSLFLFLLPSAALAPVKFLALYWLAGGHPALGFSTIFGAKILGTALVARLYQLTRPSLVQLAWFAWAEGRVLALRTWAYGLWQNMALVRWLRPRLENLRSRLRLRWQLFRQRVGQRRGWLAQRWQLLRLRARRG